MTAKRRFIASIVATAKTDTPALPFQRGTPRKIMRIRRAVEDFNKTPGQVLKSA